MAVRPLLTTGAALLSAGALVAATPALFVPHDEVAIAAPAAAQTKTMTVEQYNLLAATILDAFFYGEGGWVSGDNDGNCNAEGAVCFRGFTGAAYWIVQQFAPDIELLPGRPLDNVFFEEGFTGVSHDFVLPVAIAIDQIAPNLTLERRVEDFYEGGVSQLVQNLINDNLPDDELGEWAKGLNDSFFEGGITGAVTYVLTSLGVITPPPAADSLDTAITTLSVEEESTEDPGSAKLPSGPLTTLDIKAPFDVKKLAATVGAPEVKTAVVEEGTEVEEEGTVDDGTTTPVGVDLPTAPETPKVELPKLPEVQLPSLPVEEVEKTEPVKEVEETEPVKEVAETEETGEAEEAVDTKGGNKVTPGSPIFETGSKKNSGGGWGGLEKAVNDLKKAFSPKEKPAADSDAGSDDSGE